MAGLPAFHYTTVADLEVEAQLNYAIGCIRAEIAALPLSCRPEYVYLGGGYGRGEGGVSLRSDGRKTLYNDLDMFVFAIRASRKRRREIDFALQEIGERWSAALELAVDFPPCRNISKLAQYEHTLMFQELLQGHQLVFGDRDFLADWPRLAPADIPALESFRLMLNRGVGLLLAAERLVQPKPSVADRDFALRNLHKAVLGCGDALLLQQKKYRYCSQARQECLQRENPLPGSALPEMYTMSLLYKARPITEPDCDLSMLWEQVRQFWQQSLQVLLVQCSDNGSGIAKNNLRLRLLRLRGLSAQSPARHALRWLWRTRRILPLQDLTCDPIIRTLADLCPLILENDNLEKYINPRFFCVSPTFRAFIRLWAVFN